jgi:glycerophosphoryl diester phosphodiesterase
LTPNPYFDTLDRTIQSDSDHALALRHAPCIRFDAREPFLPSVVGYTVFRENAPSPSFPREVILPANAACTIEYAVWWDWEIQHLYELEHIWVYLDADERVVAADASWHGRYHAMVDEQGNVPLQGNRVVVYSEPGKHAFAPSPQWLLERAPETRASCGLRSGMMGVHVTPLFEGIIRDRLPLNNRLVHTYLERLAFEPAYEFANEFDLATCILVPWNNLFRWIPERVAWWCQELRRTIPPHQQRVLRIAHRGASAYAQENSLTAFHKAAEMLADMVEVDIRITVDQIPVVAHDSDLRRLFGINSTIADLTFEQLRAATPPGLEPVPSFEEVVATCKALGLGLYLDIKEFSRPAAQSIFATLKAHGMTRYTIFGSFRHDWVAEIKAASPDVSTSILFSSTHVDPVLLARALGCDYVHPCWENAAPEPHRLLTPDWMRAVREAELGIICWHEERPSEIAALQALGVDGICSDTPERLVPTMTRTA